jgi:hypothetical protein
MIVSHKYQFIFIKTTKTAGTSIEVDINKVLGKDDIATPIFPEVKGHQAQNYIINHEILGEIEFVNHMPAKTVRKLLGDEVWNRYFKFCVEREPVSKVISHYSMLVNSPYHNKDTKNLSFNDYIERKNFPVDTAKYTDNRGRLIVDKILRYESLSKDLENTAEYLGFKVNLNAKCKSGFRIDLEVTNEQRSIIYDAFSSSNIFTRYHNS